MTSLDVWMLICMMFVAAAQFEYAVQLKVRFGNMSKIGSDVSQEGETLSERKCRKVDNYALKVFLLAYVLTAAAYFYKVAI